MKRLIKIFMVLILFIILIFIVIKSTYSSTPNILRNNDVSGVKIDVKIDNDDRKPIIKTFYLDEYNNKSDKEKIKIEEQTAGNIEGDIPCVNLVKGNKIHIKFLKEDKTIKFDEIPKIELISRPSYYEDESGNKIIKDELAEGNNNEYNYEIKRYNKQYEKWFIEYNFVKITYSIHGNSYISLFSINSSNAKDGTDFFENEKLDKPILAE